MVDEANLDGGPGLDFEILEIVDRGNANDRGELLFSGTAEDAINDPAVKEKYLGNTEQKLYTAQSA